MMEYVGRQGAIILALRSTKAPTLPKGLPPLPSTPTTYMIFVQQKQWTKVRDAMQHADDALIVEGYPVHEPRFAGITVYATQVTTKALQAASGRSSQQRRFLGHAGIAEYHIGCANIGPTVLA